jgi:hypothetical protein
MEKWLALAMIGAFGAVAAPALATGSQKTNTQQNKMTQCQAQAGEKKLEGKERQAFVNECLKAKPAPAEEKPKNKMAECNAKTKGLKKEEADKVRAECMKAK